MVLIDADSCPVSCLSVARRVGKERGLRVVTVASPAHAIRSGDHVTVDLGPQAADLAIVNRVRAGDVVVTRDWGLAALVMARHGRALDPRGRIFSPGSVDFMLEERHLKAAVRRGGGRTKGPPPRSRGDDARFEASLRRLLGEGVPGVD